MFSSKFSTCSMTFLRTSGLYCGGYHAFQRTSRSCAQIIPAVKQNLIKVESFFFSLRLCHGFFLQSENYKLRTKRTHCCGKQCIRAHKCKFCVAKCLLGNPKPFLICTVPVQATRSFRTLLNVSIPGLRVTQIAAHIHAGSFHCFGGEWWFLRCARCSATPLGSCR